MNKMLREETVSTSFAPPPGGVQNHDICRDLNIYGDMMEILYAQNFVPDSALATK